MEVSYEDKRLLLHPTNTCFSDVIDYLNEQCKLKTTDEVREFAKNIWIVHGILQNKNRPYSHAWLETRDEVVFHSGILNNKFVWCEFNIKEYHQNMKVKEFTRYTIEEAILEERKAGRPGPWKRQYYRLCRDVRKKQMRQDHKEKNERQVRISH